jgi:hypothetical protein
MNDTLRIVRNKIAQLQRLTRSCTPENLELHQKRLDLLFEWRDNVILSSRS